MSLITLSHVGKQFGAQQIFEGVSFCIERADHIGLVGANGAGKSTLLRIIAGLEEPDTGTISRSRNVRVAYLPQDPEFEASETLYDAMLAIFRPVIDAQDRLRVLEEDMAESSADAAAVDEYGRLQALVEHTGYDYRRRIEQVLTGLGLAPDSWQTRIEHLSGGQRTRANLARTLMQDADVLLLDEPTNHLDIPAVEWLEGYLRDLKRAFVVVAHDRYLLDHVTSRTLELSFGRVTAYDAPYSRYLQLKAERMERQQEEYEAQQEHIAKTEEFIRRYGAGQRSREARGRQKQLDRLDRVERPREEETVRLRLGRAKRSGDVVLQTADLVVGYPGHLLARLPEEVVVRRRERVAIIGPNGSGKTTLLRTLAGDLPPLEGQCRWGANTSVAYHAQSLEGLNEQQTVLEEIQSAKAMSEEEARSLLGRFLFAGDDAFKRVGVLSGGEKSRLALARLILRESNVLLLDEPTNHLDIASREAFQAVLTDFAGTLLFASHDRYLIDALAQQLWVVRDGRVARFVGGYSAFAAGQAQPVDAAQPLPAHREEERLPPEERLHRLEDDVEMLAGQLAEIGPTAPLGELWELTERYADVQARLQETQSAWLRDLRDQLRASSG